MRHLVINRQISGKVKRIVIIAEPKLSIGSNIMLGVLFKKKRGGLNSLLEEALLFEAKLLLKGQIDLPHLMQFSCYRSYSGV